MEPVYFATTNKGKVSSIRTALSRYGVEVVHYPLELPEPRSDDLIKIAKEKVLFAYEHIRRPCIALDSGFYVHSLNGFPKAFVNFVLDTIGIEGILKLADGKPRDCEFRYCLTYLDETLVDPVCFESSVEGVLSDRPIGELRDYHWSKLSLVFIPRGMDKTLAEITFEEFQRWRAQNYKDSYVTRFAKWLMDTKK